ncbi:MAG: hypothetical protein IAF02_20190 [Anaerolineae bacterium]|nr:hypothetical protein [Anaerolineae bacterium]
MTDYMSFIFPVMIMIVVILSLGEMVISGMWLPAYYRYSIPLFRKEYPLTMMPDLAAKIPELEQKLKRSMGRRAIVFRALNANEIAFRNNFGSRNAMSGLIRLQPDQGRMRISGNLYWTFFLLPFIFFLTMFTFPLSAFFLLFVVAGFMITFGMQRYQYGKIAAVIVATAVTAEPIDTNTAYYASKPEKIVPEESYPSEYKANYAPYNTPNSPQSGLNRTEIMLLVILAALIVIAGALAFIFLIGG